MTVRQQIRIVSDETKWMEEIEPNGLPKPEIIPASVPVPLSLPILTPGANIFPELTGFGSLDSSSLPLELSERLQNFFTLLSQIPAPSPENSSEPVSAHSEQAFRDFFPENQPFLPLVLRYTFQKMHPVLKWIIGLPVEIQGTYEIPVRLYGGEKYTEMIIYAKKTDKGIYVIEQIQFGATSDGKFFKD